MLFSTQTMLWEWCQDSSVKHAWQFPFISFNEMLDLFFHSVTYAESSQAIYNSSIILSPQPRLVFLGLLTYHPPPVHFCSPVHIPYYPQPASYRACPLGCDLPTTAS